MGPISLAYPDDFRNAEKLEPGTYRVEWYVPKPQTLATAVLPGFDPVLGVLVRDDFVVEA
jgi:hypothetical protein